MMNNLNWHRGVACEFSGKAKDAVTHYIQAAKDDYIPAFRRLGEFYHEGFEVPQNEETAHKCFLYAANRGDAHAQFFVAIQYHEGLGTPKDLKLYVHWLRKAAKQHHAKAVYYLGRAYLDGDGVQANQQQGLKLLQQAADLNLPEAQVHLYLQDKSKVALLKSAAEAGYPLAQMELGIHYAAENNTSAAIHWYSLAAETIVEARLALATYYLDENGTIPQDFAKVAIYLERYIYPQKGDTSVSDTADTRAFALEWLAYAYRKLGREAEALNIAKIFAQEFGAPIEDVLKDWNSND